MGTLVGSPGNPLAFGNDPFLNDCLPMLDELLEGMTANEGASGDAVPFSLFDYGAEPMFIDNSGPDESSPQRSSTFVSGVLPAASNASPIPVCRAAESHFPNTQSNVRHGGRVEDVTAHGSSLSPGSDRMVLTPISTIDYTASTSNRADEDVNVFDCNVSPTSTESTDRTDSDYVLISSRNTRQTAARLFARQTGPANGNRPPPSSIEAFRGSDVQLASRASSLTPSTMSWSSGPAQWGSMTESSPDGAYDYLNNSRDQISDAFAAFTSGDYDHVTTAPTTAQYDANLLFGEFTVDNDHNTTLPYRHSPGQHGPVTNHPSTGPLVRDYAQPQQYYQQVQHQYGRPAISARLQGQAIARDSVNTAPTFRPSLQVPSAGASTFQQPTSFHLTNAQQSQVQVKIEPQQLHAPASYQAIATIPSKHTPSPPRRTQTAAQPFAPAHQRQRPNPVPSSSSRPLPSLASAPPQAVAQRQARQPQGTRAGRGGRQKDSHLPESARKKSHAMRKIAACWRCALQRDPCDEGSPCNRCKTRYDKGQLLFFACDRSKLPDFVHDFLPPQASMTLMHQKQTIEDTVKDQVVQWDELHPIDVYLTSGYGPPLRWKLHEFRPRTNDLLGQFQYMQDPNTGRLLRYHKYSPPFGLIKLNASDDSHFDDYLNILLDDQYIWELGWTCFEEESQVDASQFQASLLNQMCVLYVKTQDPDLKHLLKDILRMMILTYIMGHTLTIEEGTLPTVLNSVKFTPPGPPQKHTSPRLANRQLKFYFAVLRSNIYEKILKWQQQVLHTSGKKDESWLTSFCAMLGFAMVLEEVQRTLQIQADAKKAKDELPHDQADTEARNACERIDERFELLVGLFQCKYRDRKWGDNGSFGPGTPQFTEGATVNFLYHIRQLLDENSGNLEYRKSVQFSPDNYCLYTSRLVARFLLPFLNLPRG